MDILHIDELMYPMGNGSTLPIFGMTDNQPYVVKTFNNIEGNKVLVNEVISYLIAKKLELPIPEAKLCLIDNNTTIDRNVTDMEEFSEACYGIGFCSKYIQKSTIISSAKMIKLAENYKWVIPKIMLLDHIIYNKDRNKGNLLLTTNKDDKQLILIDHSHTFNLECIWDSIGLRQKIAENDYNDINIMINNGYLYSMFKEVLELDMVMMSENIEYFKRNLNEGFFKEIVDQIPESWENSKSELNSVAEYLIYRFKNIDNYSDIISSFKY